MKAKPGASSTQLESLAKTRHRGDSGLVERYAPQSELTAAQPFCGYSRDCGTTEIVLAGAKGCTMDTGHTECSTAWDEGLWNVLHRLDHPTEWRLSIFANRVLL